MTDTIRETVVIRCPRCGRELQTPESQARGYCDRECETAHAVNVYEAEVLATR